MIDEAMEAILVELKQLSRAFSEATRQIIRQQGEINALQQIVQQQGMVTPEEWNAVRETQARELMESIDRPEPPEPEGRPRRLPQPSPSVCRRRLELVRRAVPPR